MTSNAPIGKCTILLACCLTWLSIHFLTGQSNPKIKIGLRDFLKEYLNLNSLPVYHQDTYIAQTSSYDTSGGNDDGFSGKYSYLYHNLDSTLTIFETKGPGVIQRIWTPTPSEDSLEFFIDDLAKPAFTIRYKDLFSGQVYPFVAPLCNNQLGGYYCYLPIPFNQACKIVYKGKKTQFHQIQYRTYPAHYELQSFSLKLQSAEKKSLLDIKDLWSQSIHNPASFYLPSVISIKESKKNLTLNPGQVLNLFNSTMGGRILGIELGPAGAFSGLDKNVDIKITWDDETQPAVYCPVSEFFGYAFDKPSMKSLLLGSDGDKNFCYFPMPYDRKARIDLIYRKRGTSSLPALTIHSKIFYLLKPREPAKEGKFYTFRSSQHTTLNKPHTLLDITGKGHYVGTILLAQGLKPGMTLFFEGDDSTAVDGQYRMHGTGSEDYFNGGWYALLDRWDGSYSLPLSGSLDYSLPFCRTGGYRLFLADKISFKKSFFHSIEHGPVGNAFPAIYTSIAHYYADRPPKHTLPPQSNDTRGYQPDTLIVYPQLLPFNIEGDIQSVTKWAYPTGGLTYYFTVTSGSLLRTTFAEIPEGHYQLALDYIQSPESCEFSIWQRQTPLTGWNHADHDQIRRIPFQNFTPIHFDRLNQTLTFQFKTEGEKNKFILNRIFLIKVHT